MVSLADYPHVYGDISQWQAIKPHLPLPADPAICYLFSKTQEPPPATDFLGHPVTKMLLNFMRKSFDEKCILNWRRGPDFGPGWLGAEYGGVPDNFWHASGAKQALRDGASALFAKAAYNGYPAITPHLDASKFNSGVTSLNDYYTAHATDLYIDYVRFAEKIEPSAQKVASYTALLEHAAWRNMKAGQLTTAGGWQNPDLEMFIHFVMLSALGASDADLRSVYTTITTTEPKLDAGAFSSITPDKWRAYRGWLSAGLLDGANLSVGNFGAQVMIPNPMPNKTQQPLHYQAYTIRFCQDHGWTKGQPFEPWGRPNPWPPL